MILKNCTIHEWFGSKYATGNIFGDEHERFTDGTLIRTSAIEDSWKDKSSHKKYIKTKNSIYEIE